MHFETESVRARDAYFLLLENSKPQKFTSARKKVRRLKYNPKKFEFQVRLLDDTVAVFHLGVGF